MKKNLHIIIISILVIQCAFAQEEIQKQQKKFKYGFTTGLNLYNIKSTGTIEYLNNIMDESSSFYFGTFAEMNLSDKFSLRGEFVYALGINSDFLEVPIILRYKLSDKIYLYGGVQLNYMLEERNKYFNKVGFGFSIGIEYNFSENWFIDLRYVHKETQHSLFNDLGSQTSSVRFGIGYRF